jgi:hypothetical protein
VAVAHLMMIHFELIGSLLNGAASAILRMLHNHFMTARDQFHQHSTNCFCANRFTAIFTGIWLKAWYMVKVEHKFYFSVITKLGLVLLVKLNGTKEFVPVKYLLHKNQ